MPKEKSQKGFRLPSVDDLFSSAEERETEKLTSGRIMDVPISEIDDFPEHPFMLKTMPKWMHLWNLSKNMVLLNLQPSGKKMTEDMK